MDADQRQFGKVDRDAIERNRAADARQPAVALVDQTVADLHHDRNVEFGAARVVRDSRSRDPAPVRTSADKDARRRSRNSLTAHSRSFSPAMPRRRIDARRARKTGADSADTASMDPLIGNFETSRSRAGRRNAPQPITNARCRRGPFSRYIARASGPCGGSAPSSPCRGNFHRWERGPRQYISGVYMLTTMSTAPNPKSGMGGGEGIGVCRHGCALIRGFRQRSVLRPDGVISLRSRHPERTAVRQAVAAI